MNILLLLDKEDINNLLNKYINIKCHFCNKKININILLNDKYLICNHRKFIFCNKLCYNCI